MPKPHAVAVLRGPAFPKEIATGIAKVVGKKMQPFGRGEIGIPPGPLAKEYVSFFTSCIVAEAEPFLYFSKEFEAFTLLYVTRRKSVL